MRKGHGSVFEHLAATVEARDIQRKFAITWNVEKHEKGDSELALLSLSETRPVVVIFLIHAVLLLERLFRPTARTQSGLGDDLRGFA